VNKQFLVVTAPVANLRKEPIEAPAEYVFDDLQETQLLYNECLLYKEENEDWYYVDAVEQKKATRQGDWQGYPGWIQKTSAMFINVLPVFNAVVNHVEAVILKDPSEKSESLFEVSIGTKLAIEDSGNNGYSKTTLNNGRKSWIRKNGLNILAPVMDTGRLRKNIIETTKLFLGISYLWGGRSSFGAESREQRKTEALALNLLPPTSNLQPIATGVDCSSLTNLAYRVNCVDIPRDAHDQWSVFTGVAYDTLAPADLIFVSAEDVHDKITHVMMYLGGEEFIEALETGSVVSINTFKNKFGVTLHEAAQKRFIVNKRKIYFGSILIAGEKK
jgi:gamma-D-glutamyl-L-lysine dipeptidyl-peptidase